MIDLDRLHTVGADRLHHPIGGQLRIGRNTHALVVDDGQAVHRLRTAGLGALLVPPLRLGRVGGNADTEFVVGAGLVHGERQAGARGLQRPDKGERCILGHTNAVAVEQGQLEHRRRHALVGRAAIPLRGGGRILRRAAAVEIPLTEIGGGHGIARFRRPLGPGEGALVVLRHAASFGIKPRERHHRAGTALRRRLGEPLQRLRIASLRLFTQAEQSHGRAVTRIGRFFEPASSLRRIVARTGPRIENAQHHHRRRFTAVRLLAQLRELRIGQRQERRGLCCRRSRFGSACHGARHDKTGYHNDSGQRVHDSLGHGLTPSLRSSRSTSWIRFVK